jgi:hypothetical protein
VNATPSSTEVKPDDGYPNYPGFGDPDDIHARIMLLEWIQEQIANGNVQAKVGDYVLATDGRILGVSQDPDELHSRLLIDDPSLANARLVAYLVPLVDF